MTMPDTIATLKRDRRLLCRLFGHKWQATHCNRYMIDTRQVCRCGAVREWQGGIEGGWVEGGRDG
jgi:hypothetical protein